MLAFDHHKHQLDVFHRRCLRAILGISWRDHVTNEEVTRRTGTERLQDIVKKKEIENCWPRPPTAARKTRTYSNAIGGGRRRHGVAPSKKTSKRWVSDDMEAAGSPLTVMGGGFSSPDAPRGTR